jgi:acetolactate synthase small subunit|uniref:ACT domain-containing protein n=1 Tax=Acidicaldus sp. TaxID=1872105 RepID=A0A8J4H9Q3_9PROT
MTDDDTLLPPRRFRLLAEAEPGLLPRVLAPLARRGVILEQLIVTRQGAALAIEIVIPPLPAAVLRPIAGNLRQIVGLVALTEETLAGIAIAA